MAALERERCPNDGTDLWYHTDTIGRLSGRCDVCGGRFWKSTVPNDPVAPPPIVTRKEVSTRDLVVALVIERPGIAKQAICGVRGRGLNSDRTRRALDRLVADGTLVKVQTRLQPHHSKPTTCYYHRDYDGPRHEHMQSMPERVLEVVAAYPDGVTVDVIGATLDITAAHASRLCRDAVYAKKLVQVVTVERQKHSKRRLRVLSYRLP